MFTHLFLSLRLFLPFESFFPLAIVLKNFKLHSRTLLPYVFVVYMLDTKARGYAIRVARGVKVVDATVAVDTAEAVTAVVIR